MTERNLPRYVYAGRKMDRLEVFSVCIPQNILKKKQNDVMGTVSEAQILLGKRRSH